MRIIAFGVIKLYKIRFYCRKLLFGALNFAYAKKSRGLKNLCFYVFIILSDREPSFLP